jgi:hypothetical protein
MCMICDGYDADDVLFYVHGKVASRGWAICPVGGPDDERSWVYTIGFAGGFDHPELVLVDTEVEFAAAVLNELGERLRDGERFDEAEGVTMRDGLEVQLVDVDFVHIDAGLLNLWFEYYGALGPPYPTPAPTARQVLLPDECFCDEHKGEQARLDLLDPVLDPDPAPPPNRAARRAAERERRRKRRRH